MPIQFSNYSLTNRHLFVCVCMYVCVCVYVPVCQCKSRRSYGDLTYCTSSLHKKNKNAVCRKKYCEHCLKKFYKIDKTELTGQVWKCPSCRKICCCAACRRREMREGEGGNGTNSNQTNGNGNNGEINSNNTNNTTVSSNNGSANGVSGGVSIPGSAPLHSLTSPNTPSDHSSGVGSASTTLPSMNGGDRELMGYSGSPLLGNRSIHFLPRSHSLLHHHHHSSNNHSHSHPHSHSHSHRTHTNTNDRSPSPPGSTLQRLILSPRHSLTSMSPLPKPCTPGRGIVTNHHGNGSGSGNGNGSGSGLKLEVQSDLGPASSPALTALTAAASSLTMTISDQASLRSALSAASSSSSNHSSSSSSASVTTPTDADKLLHLSLKPSPIVSGVNFNGFHPPSHLPSHRSNREKVEKYQDRYGDKEDREDTENEQSSPTEDEDETSSDTDPMDATGSTGTDNSDSSNAHAALSQFALFYAVGQLPAVQAAVRHIMCGKQNNSIKLKKIEDVFYDYAERASADEVPLKV